MRPEELQRIGDMLSNEGYRDCMECSWDARANSLYEHIHEQEAELRALREVAKAAAEFRTAAAIYRDVGGSVEPMVRAEIALIRCFQSPVLAAIKEEKK